VRGDRLGDDKRREHDKTIQDAENLGRRTQALADARREADLIASSQSAAPTST